MKRIMGLILALLMLSSCGAEYVAKVNNEKISKGEFEFYLDTIKEQMKGTELANDEDWQTQEIEGRKAIDVAKDRALEVAVDNIAYIEILDYLDLELTDAEEKQVSALENMLVSQYGGKDKYNSFLKERGIDKDFTEMLCKASVCSEKLTELAIEKYPITEQEVIEKCSLLAGTLYNAKHILFLTIDDASQEKLPEDVVAQKKALAEDIYSKILLSSSDDVFDKYMNEYSEDPGLATSPDGYLFGTGEMVVEFENAVASLEVGGYTLIESEFGYHIIKRLPITTEDIVNSPDYSQLVDNQLSASKLSKAMTEWKQSAGIKIEKNEEVFDKIK